ncbi:MAG: hypothetical protein K1X89_03090 [Myxococcaceae bacterium]|nr:hypothetical protein [Myxococcaceae bacterium]
MRFLWVGVVAFSFSCGMCSEIPSTPYRDEVQLNGSGTVEVAPTDGMASTCSVDCTAMACPKDCGSVPTQARLTIFPAEGWVFDRWTGLVKPADENSYGLQSITPYALSDDQFPDPTARAIIAKSVVGKVVYTALLHRIDAGVDGGMDASMQQPPDEDGGADGGKPDAGKPDAGPGDAGPGDAGSDAGHPLRYRLIQIGDAGTLGCALGITDAGVVSGWLGTIVPNQGLLFRTTLATASTPEIYATTANWYSIFQAYDFDRTVVFQDSTSGAMRLQSALEVLTGPMGEPAMVYDVTRAGIALGQVNLSTPQPHSVAAYWLPTSSTAVTLAGLTTDPTENCLVAAGVSTGNLYGACTLNNVSTQVHWVNGSPVPYALDGGLEVRHMTGTAVQYAALGLCDGVRKCQLDSAGTLIDPIPGTETLTKMPVRFSPVSRMYVLGRFGHGVVSSDITDPDFCQDLDAGLHAYDFYDVNDQGWLAGCALSSVDSRLHPVACIPE